MVVVGFRLRLVARIVVRSGFDRIEAEMPPDIVGQIIVERTGMGLLVVNAQFGQEVDDLAGFDLQLSRELVDADLTHSYLRRATALRLLFPVHLS